MEEKEKSPAKAELDIMWVLSKIMHKNIRQINGLIELWDAELPREKHNIWREAFKDNWQVIVRGFGLCFLVVMLWLLALSSR